MGSSVSSLIDRVYRRKPYHIVILGFESAGKTSLLYRLKTNTLVETIPTQGYNSEQINLKYGVCDFWDMGGGKLMRRLWRHYYNQPDGIVFVVDASDKDTMRIQESVEDFNKLMETTNNEHDVVLIVANKQDLGDCRTEEDIIETFELRNRLNVTWRVQSTSMKVGNGIEEGMDWFSKELRKWK